MKAVTGSEMGRVDSYSIEKLGIPGIVLMENAALKVVKHIDTILKREKRLKDKVIIIAGKGNNAGDAFAVARHMAVGKLDVKLYCLFDKEFITGDARTNFDILPKIGLNIDYIDNSTKLDMLKEDIKAARIVVDGIFGTGFRGQIQGIIAEVIELINEYSQNVLSIDIASGIESATGKVADICVRANKTIGFELPKIGQLIYPGAEYTGELIIESIGMPQEALESIQSNINLTELVHVKNIMPKRSAEFNKGNCGKLLIVTGSSGMAGSGCIAAKAALRTGTGLVYIAAPSSMVNIYQSVVPEAIAIRLEDSKGVVGEESLPTIVGMLKKCNAAAIGPGLSNEQSVYNILEGISEKIDIPLVLDADALNAISKNTGIFGNFKSDVVITPHPGELSRLTGLSIKEIQENRIETAKKYAVLWGVTVVLKGAKTIIADKNGRVFINQTGNPGMATAGSGDALAGIIASLIGQGVNCFDAAVAGVYLHGLAGDIAKEDKGEHGLTAMDITEKIPYAVRRLI